jgi:glycosyltransferase involved in cell wall biosynthesis
VPRRGAPATVPHPAPAQRGEPARGIRLAIVCDAVLPFHAGGKETRHHEIASRLGRAGFDVQIHTMGWWGRAREYLGGGLRYRALCPLISMYRRDRRSLWQAVAFAVTSLRMLCRRFDVLEGDSIPVVQVFVLRLVTLLRRRPLVVTWHEVWGPAYWRQYLGRLGPLAAWLERWALRMPDHIVSPSPGTASRIVELVGDRVPVTVVPNGIDLAGIARVRPAPRTCDIIFVGRLIRHKNVDALIRGVAALTAAGHRASCLIVGTGPDEPELRALVVRLGLAEQIQFAGRVRRDEEVTALLKSARVFASLSAREGFGVAVLEALACGLPVVAFDHPDNHARDLLAGGCDGRLLRDLEPGTVAAALRWALAWTGPPAAATVALVRRHDWGRAARQMGQVYAGQRRSHRR